MATTEEAADLSKLPINVLNERLCEAHATLDLLYTMTAGADALEHIETLCKGTLSHALHGAMLRIEEALEAAERMKVAS
jgi:hypothetical protein